MEIYTPSLSLNKLLGIPFQEAIIMLYTRNMSAEASESFAEKILS